MLKRTLISSYVAQAYVAGLGLAMMPVYLRLMGSEAFGLIGVYLMLQSWLQLFDFGLTPVFSREMSRLRAGQLEAGAARGLLRVLERVVLAAAAAGVLVLTGASEWVASAWLRPVHLAPEAIAACLVAMAIAAGLRWWMGLFRAGLVGLEQQIWVNRAAVTFATVRLVGVLPVLALGDGSPLLFFLHQAAVGIVEAFAFRVALRARMPAATPSPHAGSLGPMLGAMAFLTVIWTLQTQADKLVLSRMLPLDEYGVFTLAAVVGGGLLMLLPPLQQALQPRMTQLAVQARGDELAQLYRVATQFVVLGFGSVGGTLAALPGPALHAWTGMPAPSAAAAPVLAWYAAAHALVGMMALPYLLQFAYGSLRLHLWGSTAMVTILVPGLAYASALNGALGAAQCLFAVQLLYLLLWLPRVHRRFLGGPHVHARWLCHEVLPVLGGIALALLAWRLLPRPSTRWGAAFDVAGAFALAAAAGALAGSETRTRLRRWRTGP